MRPNKVARVLAILAMGACLAVAGTCEPVQSAANTLNDNPALNQAFVDGANWGADWFINQVADFTDGEANHDHD